MQITFFNQKIAAILGTILASQASVCLASELPSSEPTYRSELSTGLGFVKLNLTTFTSTQYSFTQAYSYSLTRLLQVGGQLAISDSGAQIDPFQFSFYVPVTFNFGGEDLRSDFFARILPGANWRHVWSPVLMIQAGKRFKLFENVSWRPMVGVRSEFGNGDPRVSFDIIPLTFSVIF